MEEIYNARIAQAELKYFKDAMRKMEQQDRQIRLAEARREGRRLYDVERSEKEAEVLDAQGHDFFSDWSPQEQERFKMEQERMWAMIPEKFRAKAERMARGN